jgi:soluble lytic murein transglycosylase-like protein
VEEHRLELSATARTAARELRPAFDAAADSSGEDAFLLMGIAWGESGFRADARNGVSGAAGVMQVMPFHFPALGWTGSDWADPRKNIPAGARILADSRRAWRGRRSPASSSATEKALAQYGGFATWLRTGSAIDAAGRYGPAGAYARQLDARWYINEALARAF